MGEGRHSLLKMAEAHGCHGLYPEATQRWNLADAGRARPSLHRQRNELLLRRLQITLKGILSYLPLFFKSPEVSLTLLNDIFCVEVPTGCRPNLCHFNPAFFPQLSCVFIPTQEPKLAHIGSSSLYQSSILPAVVPHSSFLLPCPSVEVKSSLVPEMEQSLDFQISLWFRRQSQCPATSIPHHCQPCQFPPEKWPRPWGLEERSRSKLAEQG